MMIPPERQMTGRPKFPSPPPVYSKSFSQPSELCSIVGCPDFAKACGLCNMHCIKIHTGKHYGLTKENLKEIVDKYNKKELK